MRSSRFMMHELFLGRGWDGFILWVMASCFLVPFFLDVAFLDRFLGVTSLITLLMAFQPL